jgi:SAM-dependent methyltransferase
MTPLVRRIARALVPAPLRPWAHTTYMRVRYRGDVLAMKHAQELRFWHDEQAAEGGRLYNDHIRRTFVEAFGLDEGAFRGARMLDIGCGPLGSLEWADDAASRIGLDPLADSYRGLGIAAQAMQYVAALAERMPFPAGTFDVVSSFNSLDHVDDLDATVAEVKRVLAPGGSFLLLVEVNHPPTLTEPISLGWDVTRRFAPELEVAHERHLDTTSCPLYHAALGGVELADPADPRAAGLLVRFTRTA